MLADDADDADDVEAAVEPAGIGGGGAAATGVEVGALVGVADGGAGVPAADVEGPAGGAVGSGTAGGTDAPPPVVELADVVPAGVGGEGAAADVEGVDVLPAAGWTDGWGAAGAELGCVRTIHVCWVTVTVTVGAAVV